VADIFRRAQALRQGEFRVVVQAVESNSLVRRSFPVVHAVAAQSDHTGAGRPRAGRRLDCGLPIVRRGIQFQDWKEIVGGILLSLEQTENYERARGPEGDRDEWHNRNVGIEDATAKGVAKWMPDELIALAEKQGKK
jgi:hypothetical protein